MPNRLNTIRYTKLTAFVAFLKVTIYQKLIHRGSSLPIVCKIKQKIFGQLKLKIEDLREYEFIFEKALAQESGGPGVLIDEKN
jgi:hypothetical protein